MEFENTERIQFCELSREQQLSLFSAWLNGCGIENYDDWWDDNDGWRSDPCPVWAPLEIYRIMPVKPKILTKPSIEWSHVADRYKWLAVSKYDRGWLFEYKPDVGREGWLLSVDETGANAFSSADAFSSYVRGTCDWKDSLVKRPC